MISLSNATKKELKVLTKDQILEVLQNEWDKSKLNDQYKWNYHDLERNNKKIIIELLRAYFLNKSNFEVSNNNPNSPYIGKMNGNILGSISTKLEDKDFISYIKLLFLNGYLQKVDLMDVSHTSSEAEFGESFYRAPMFQIPHEHNLLWIFEKYEDLFSFEILADEDDLSMIEHGGGFFKSYDSPEEILYKMMNSGTIVDLITRLDSLLSLSDRGMYILHLEQYIKSEKFIKEQKKVLNSIKVAKKEQEVTTDKLTDTENKLHIVHSEMKREFKSHKIKINSFYKDIASILSILVAAFAVIGVNISAIPKIESNFSVNVLVLNFSLISVLCILFLLLKKTVFIHSNDDAKSTDKILVGISVVSVLLISGVFIIGKFYEEPRNGEKNIQIELKEQLNKIYEQNKKINDIYEKYQNNKLEIRELEEAINQLNTNKNNK